MEGRSEIRAEVRNEIRAEVRNEARDGRVLYATTLLNALAEPHRQTVLRLLERHQLSQRELVLELGISQPLVSHHLKVLREAGLVESTICGRTRVYRLRAQTLSAIARRLTVMAERARVMAELPAC